MTVSECVGGHTEIRLRKHIYYNLLEVQALVEWKYNTGVVYISPSLCHLLSRSDFERNGTSIETSTFWTSKDHDN